MIKPLIVAFAIVCSLCCGQAWAEPTSHEIAAEQLLGFLDLQGIMDRNIDMSLDTQVKQNPGLLPFKEVMREYMRKYMNAERLKGEFVKLFVSEFSEQELNEMSAFYATPTGKKVVAKLMVVSSKAMDIGAAQVQENVAELKKMIAEVEAKQKEKKQ
jgi:hypothetical protein